MNIAIRSAFRADRHRSGAVLARLELFDSFASAEPLWRRLETDALATPYQRFEWLRHWYCHVGRPRGAELLIIAGLDSANAPAFILPLTCERHYGCRIAGFGGGSHANLNMPLWRRGIADGFTGSDVANVLDEIAAARQIDLFALLGQPPNWDGIGNPLAALPGQPSPDDVFTASLEGLAPQFQFRLPSGMRKKERRLMSLPGYRFAMAQTVPEVDQMLTAFRSQKATRFHRQGIRNVFVQPGIMDFIRAACLEGLEQGRPAIELHAIDADGETLAVVGGVSNPLRFSVMFNSITAGDSARLSPGIILMAEIVRLCARRGIASIDLGAGQARYKGLFCSGSQGRIDCFVPYTARGRALAAVYGADNSIRHAFKRSPPLMDALNAARRWTTAATRWLG
jgi:CelD/BcsL family acetyltransferase involved in cellulose biosynthesis